MGSHADVPQYLPRLSPGRHRSPKRGACFMEFASYLAGERWSDNPPCTDPVLAALARCVNDVMSDERRDDLIDDIPRVIGLRGDDAVVGLVVALRAAASALPVASMERQRALAAAIHATRDVLASLGVADPPAGRAAEAALAEVPDADRWAQRHLAQWAPRPAELVRHGSMAIIRTAAIGVARACADDNDERLARMLHDAIGDVEQVLGRSAPASTAPLPERVPLTA